MASFLTMLFCKIPEHLRNTCLFIFPWKALEYLCVVLVPWGCCGKLLPAGWLTAAEISSLRLLEVRSLKSQGISKAGCPPEALGEKPFCLFQLLLVVDILSHPLAPGHMTPNSASVFTLSFPLGFWASRPLHLLSCKICIMVCRVHQFSQDKILLSRSLL